LFVTAMSKKGRGSDQGKTKTGVKHLRENSDGGKCGSAPNHIPTQSQGFQLRKRGRAAKGRGGALTKENNCFLLNLAGKKANRQALTTESPIKGV